MPSGKLNEAPSAQLIEEIVRKVLAESGLAGGAMAAVQNAGPKVLILSRPESTDAGKLRRHLPKDSSPVFLDASGCTTAEEIIDAGFASVILPFLSLKETADLALGRAAGKIPGLVLSLLMHGQEIFVLDFDHDRFGETATPAMFDLYKNYEKTLESYGLRRLTPCTKASRTVRDRLVTETHMAELLAAGVREITICPGCLVTALAADMARENGIRIVTGSAAGERKAK
ncbi:MAG: hypothetical protein MI802_04470 [Desulfobacterales bacterium]|nr:hypothetical protein [Desulfobacterales bacterium]